MAVGNLPPELSGPVQLELAKAVERLPGLHGMPGGSRYELKWDGFRAGAVCRDGEVRLWSRNGKDFTTKFPDVQAALAAQWGRRCRADLSACRSRSSVVVSEIELSASMTVFN